MIFIMENENIAKPRKYFEGRGYHRDYFCNIDTEEKAYILGFLWGDGSYIPSKRTIALAVAKIDEPHLQRIAECLGLGESGIRRHMSCSFGHQEFPYSKIQMSHKIFFESMERLGYCKKPQRMKRIPNIPAELIRHFLRGLFDADGSVSCSPRGKSGLSRKGRMEVSLPHLESVNWWIQSFQETLDVQFHPKKDKSIYRVTIERKADLRKIYNYLYSDSVIHLDRKHKKFRELIGDDNVPEAQAIEPLAA